MKIFNYTLNNEVYTIICERKKTRNGFKHEATLLHNNTTLDSTKICYLNRTWERYEFESVINKILERNYNEHFAKVIKENIDKER